MFIDTARIHIKAGNGGNGAVAFHREKYVPAGGPDGGDGGRGGSIIFTADDNLSTLMDYRYKRNYTASPGEDGSGSRRSGKDGASLQIRLPRGTLIRDAETNAIIHDLSDGEPFVAAKGGRGGWGNAHFATPTRQAPRFAKSGLHGEERDIILELKLLADVGLIGFPNTGKSTLLSVISAARPKIANYHFTTLTPNLGVVYIGENASFVAADIPGIIEGASEGAGLGYDFLRHIDRCRLLIHVIDVSGIEGRDPVDDFERICHELRAYSAHLASCPQIIAANKLDIPHDAENMRRLSDLCAERGMELIPVSAATRQNVDKLVAAAYHKLCELPPIVRYEPEYITPEATIGERDFEIEKTDGLFTLTGKWLEHVAESIYVDEYESMNYFQRVLRKAGVFERLEEMGINEGDTVSIYGVEFEYYR